jgi:hypothetical protein
MRDASAGIAERESERANCSDTQLVQSLKNVEALKQRGLLANREADSHRTGSGLWMPLDPRVLARRPDWDYFGLASPLCSLRLAAQDVALSRRKQGFESPRERQIFQ